MLIHPAMVHFPIGLMVAVMVCLILYKVMGREIFKDLAHWNFIFGMAGIALAILSGTWDESRIEQSEALHELVEQHETFAYTILWIYMALFLWYLFRKEMMASVEFYFFLGLFTATTLFLLYTGHTGGELVYDYGAGINHSSPFGQ